MNADLHDVIEIGASTPRRVFMMATLAALGLLFLLLSASSAPMALIWRVVFIGLGAGILTFLPFAWRATGRTIILHEGQISDSSGVVLCDLAQIDVVERGAFAFKPSNGFLIRLKAPGPRGWAPGIWWRLGRKLGIGGVLPASQAKYMADMLALTLAANKSLSD